MIERWTHKISSRSLSHCTPYLAHIWRRPPGDELNYRITVRGVTRSGDGIACRTVPYVASLAGARTQRSAARRSKRSGAPRPALASGISPVR